MEFLPPAALKSFATSSKTILQLLTVRMAVNSCLFSGGRCLESICRLGTFMRNGSIYPMTPLRILHLCTSYQCEGCGRRRTQNVRPNFGILSCWRCLADRSRGLHSCGATPSFNRKHFTRKIHKGYWKQDSGSFSLNQFYYSHRVAFEKVLNHERVLAFPHGTRYLEVTNDPADFLPVLIGPFNQQMRTLIPTDDMEPGTVFRSRDRYEVVYSRATIDSAGTRLGPLLAYDEIIELVLYLSKKDNEGIDHYLDNVLMVPAYSHYSSFTTVFDKNVNAAKEKEDAVKRDRDAVVRLVHYRSIEVGVSFMAKIALHMSKGNIKRWTESIRGRDTYSSPDYYVRLSRVYRRMLLLYHEVPYVYAKWVLTYDTGCRKLDRTLHSILGDYLLKMKPSRLSTGSAKYLASRVFLATRSIVIHEPIVGIFDNGNRRNILSTFGRHYRAQYAINPTRTFPPWHDTSANRRR